MTLDLAPVTAPAAVPAAPPRHTRTHLLHAGAYAVAAAFAGVNSATSGIASFRWWGTVALPIYAFAAVVVLAAGRTSARLRTVVLCVVALGVTVVPLLQQVAVGISVSEVGILRDAGERLLATGTPFPSTEELADATGRNGYREYNVYLPVLALFGLPSAVLGDHPWTDPRLFFALFAAAVLAATRRRNAWLVVAAPPIPLGLVAGSNDLPILVLLCAALLLAERGCGLATGALAGAAAAMKALAWPALPVLLALVAVRSGRRRRRAAAFAAAAAAVLAVGIGLPALADPRAFFVNAIKFPLGLMPVSPEARSPLPGYLLAQAGPVGEAIGIALLAAAALGMLVWIVRRPPASAVEAGQRLILGWLLAMALAPSTRFGYIVYPLAILLWLYPESVRRSGTAAPPELVGAPSRRDGGRAW
jgi:hypothetical protein